MILYWTSLLTVTGWAIPVCIYEKHRHATGEWLHLGRSLEVQKKDIPILSHDSPTKRMWTYNSGDSLPAKKKTSYRINSLDIQIPTDCWCLEMFGGMIFRPKHLLTRCLDMKELFAYYNIYKHNTLGPQNPWKLKVLIPRNMGEITP